MKARTSLSFNLKLTLEQIRGHREAYLADENGMGWEREAMEAGRKLAAGDFSRDNLLVIVRWKSPRSLGHIKSNKSCEISDSLRLALDAKTPRAAMAVLCGLRGVEVPMASAILTAIKPARYTVIDRRALKTLGTKQLTPTINNYLDYLRFCDAKAKELDIPLRDLDHALWQAGA